jgi:hypothetical protein
VESILKLKANFFGFKKRPKEALLKPYKKWLEMKNLETESRK